METSITSSKKLILDKEVRGGMIVEYHYLILEDGSEIQLSYDEWRLYHIGGTYPRETPLPKSDQ
jgi:hypothetical protein